MKLLALLPLLCCCSPQPAELSIVNGAELDSFDPHLATSAASTRLLSAVFDCLTAIDPNSGALLPELASDFSASNNNRRWRFHIRPDARWSDGSAITLTDVHDSWKRLQRPSTAAPYADWLRGATIGIIDGAVQVDFESPQPLFATYCTYHALAPLPKVLRDSPPGYLPPAMLYSGPYAIAEHHIRDYTRLSINKFHRNYSDQSFATIDFLSVASQWTALNLYLDHQVDFIPQVPQLAISKLQQRHPDALKITPSFATYFIRLQQKEGSVFSNKQLRKALSLAIDRQQLVNLLGSQRQAAPGLVPNLLANYPAADSNLYQPKTARRALQVAAADLQLDEITIDYLYPASELNRTIAEFLQQQWFAELGIRVSLNQLEAKSFFPLQAAQQYQASHSTWIGDYFDPYTFLELFQSSHRNNRSSFSNLQYDQLLQDAQQSTDAQHRLLLLSQAESLLLNEYAIIPLCFDSNLQLLRPGITGHTPNKFGIIEWHKLRPAASND
ncbi:MAG: peptide ABC transporter substrate-binding protein [Planctomycetes bacterium]|nr:peptide ABC transporter substrate-binding protein [Planctomycetota bacterium]